MWANLPRCGASWPMFTSVTKVVILWKLWVFYMFFLAETWAERLKFNSGIKLRTMNAKKKTKNVKFGPTNPTLPYHVIFLSNFLLVRGDTSAQSASIWQSYCPVLPCLMMTSHDLCHVVQCQTMPCHEMSRPSFHFARASVHARDFTYM